MPKPDAATYMTSHALIKLLEVLEVAGVAAWLDGGWAVDAVLGMQTRPHKDVDIIVQVADIAKLRQSLTNMDYHTQPGGTDSNFVFADAAGRQIDIHAVVFDEYGNGIYRMANGSDWIYPAAGFAGYGVVDGISVRCLTPEVQVLCHADGYTPTEKDFRDMELLRTRFGVELPPQLTRKTS